MPIKTATKATATTNKSTMPWCQLSGHADCFSRAGPSTIWKKCSGGTEGAVYEALSSQSQLKDIVPRYYREVDHDGQKYIELQNLLHSFNDPYVMDIKMGTRTFLESEVQNTFAREDLYLKVRLDENARISGTKSSGIPSCPTSLVPLASGGQRQIERYESLDLVFYDFNGGNSEYQKNLFNNTHFFRYR